jgi:cysteine desulfuration protein SufE
MSATPAEALEELAAEFELLGDGRSATATSSTSAGSSSPSRPRSAPRPTRCPAAPARSGWSPGRSEGRVDFRGDSDAHIVRGLIAVLLRLYSGRTPAQILGFDAKAALAELGLSSALSAQRSNGWGHDPAHPPRRRGAQRQYCGLSWRYGDASTSLNPGVVRAKCFSQ